MKKNNVFLGLPNWYAIVLAGIFVFYLGLWALSGQVLAAAYHNPGQLSVSSQLIMATGGDSGEYVALASSLLHGYFALPGEAFEYFRTPGYPAFIAAIEFFHGSYLAVTFCQVLLTFATALLICMIGTKFFGKRTGIFASILFLLNPLVMLLSLQVMSDLLFAFLLFLGMSAVLFSRELVERAYIRSEVVAVMLAAAVFSLATYVRPAGAVALPLFIAPIIALPISWTRKFLYAVLLTAIFALALLPWMIRNYHDSGVFSFSSLAAYNLTAYNVPLFEASLHGDSVIAERESAQTTIGISVLDWRKLQNAGALEKYDTTMLRAAPLQYVAFSAFESIGFLTNSGLEPLLSYFSPVLHYTIPPTSTINLKELIVQGRLVLFINTITSPWWLFLERIFFAGGILFGIVGICVQRRTAFVWLALFSILYFAELAGPVAEARYRLPAEPFLALLIAAGLLGTWSLLTKHQGIFRR